MTREIGREKFVFAFEQDEDMQILAAATRDQRTSAGAQYIPAAPPPTVPQHHPSHSHPTHSHHMHPHSQAAAAAAAAAALNSTPPVLLQEPTVHHHPSQSDLYVSGHAILQCEKVLLILV